MTSNKFRMKKLMTDFIIINIVINGLFYIINFRKHTGAVTFDTISTDLFIGLLILAIFCPAAGFINIPKAINKSEMDLSHRKKSAFNKLFPHKNLARSLMLTLFTIVFSYLFFIVLPNALGLNMINHYIGFSIKVMTAVIMSGIVGYIVIELTMDDYQDKQIISLKERN
ncbi:hypothetical protein [uncultured Vagococcus sp.]|uniref:hypothetical protein n=1 Tax=uncultured Vagococcus sp. TaxID=189676 RepID=UPI0025888C64|nr:hypothetical protein [uncultured Vagococcus sp.]